MELCLVQCVSLSTSWVILWHLPIWGSWSIWTRLFPTLGALFLRLYLNSATLNARQWTESRATVAQPMASAILVSRLHVREFQFWVALLGLDPVRDGACSVQITPECFSVLRLFSCRACLWALFFPEKWEPLTPAWRAGGVCVCTRDGLWEKLGAPTPNALTSTFWSFRRFFLTLKHFLLFLRGRCVLLRTDNTTTVPHISLDWVG